MIHKIVEEQIDIDQLLVVTFTNAAAAEMRERVLNAIYQKLEEYPEDLNLQRQITLLNTAHICTIDSFCLDVVKNNFYELENISPNFRIADTPEMELLKQEILEDLFEKKYEEENEDFTQLLITYTSYRDDSPLKDLILKIYSYMESTPFPEKWLNEKIKMFDRLGIEEDFKNTRWGNILLQEIQEEVEDAIIQLEEVEKELRKESELEPFLQTIQSDLKQLHHLKEQIESWDESYQIAQNFKWITWPRKKVESELKEEAKRVRDITKKKLMKKLDKVLICDSKQANEDIGNIYPILQKLENIILEFKEEFSKRKREKNIVDFSDVEHLALNILVQEQNGEMKPTQIAKQYQEKFREIAIDEYQDSNLVQEYILTSISSGDNLFMVGDVKQSIYKFRQAMPELFLIKYNSYQKVEQTQEKETQTKGRKIQLFKNFRSRENVLDFTNLIFENIMSCDLGDVDYTKEEFLNLGADYPKLEQEIKTEIDLIEVEETEEIEIQEGEEAETEHIENIEIEARYVAQKIKHLKQSQYSVFDRKKEKVRPLEYKDIVILLRSTKEKASIYEQELIKQGIPVFSDSTQQYLDSIEIQTMMSLLKIIDNPIQDIPLVTVLRSQIGGFTDNELVEIRLCDQQDNFYDCMKKAILNGSDNLKAKLKRFLEQLEKWRQEQEYLALDEFIWKLYQETGFYHYVSLMPNGALRQANLKMLFERAKKYESVSFKGLYQFIRYMERIRTNTGDLSSAKIIGENDNVVRIMSIHKSKGLEFPVVFLVNTNKQFNEQDLRKDPILLHQELGIGAKLIDYQLQIQYDTLTREAIKNKIKIENLSEEMRILYVALTRAKEKLIIVGVQKELDKKREEIEKNIQLYPKIEEKIPKALIKKGKSYLDWILLVVSYEKEINHSIFEIQKIKKKEILKEEIHPQKNPNEVDWKKEITNIQPLDRTIKQQLEYEYKNKIATKIPTKISVTEIKNRKQEKIGTKEEQNLITFPKPTFLKEENQEITAMEKGTLLHLCLQKLNPKVEYDLKKVKEFILTLQQKKIITKQEAEKINPNQIFAFTKSKIGKELKQAKEIKQEKPFYYKIEAKEIYAEEVEEEILVQGVIDLYYINQKEELILVDYKTDYVPIGKEEQLKEKYQEQIMLYKKALEQALKRKVDHCYLYSVYLGKELEYMQ